jgi:hypothetical protein
MATAKQLAANRRNAAKSTGPRTRRGKDAARKNAYRHGLSISVTSLPASEPRVESLARKVAQQDQVALADARALAAAQLDLERVQRTKVALINRLYVFGALEAQYIFGSVADEVRYLKLMIYGKVSHFPQPPDPSLTMPPEGPERMAEAVLRSLAELKKLDRYERRALARHNRLIRAIIQAKTRC